MKATKAATIAVATKAKLSVTFLSSMHFNNLIAQLTYVMPKLR